LITGEQKSDVSKPEIQCVIDSSVPIGDSANVCRVPKHMNGRSCLINRRKIRDGIIGRAVVDHDQFVRVSIESRLRA
jgi:hypothetical protein